MSLAECGNQAWTSSRSMAAPRSRSLINARMALIPARVCRRLHASSTARAWIKPMSGVESNCRRGVLGNFFGFKYLGPPRNKGCRLLESSLRSSDIKDSVSVSGALASNSITGAGLSSFPSLTPGVWISSISSSTNAINCGAKSNGAHRTPRRHHRHHRPLTQQQPPRLFLRVLLVPLPARQIHYPNAIVWFLHRVGQQQRFAVCKTCVSVLISRLLLRYTPHTMNSADESVGSGITLGHRPIYIYTKKAAKRPKPPSALKILISTL